MKQNHAPRARAHSVWICPEMSLIWLPRKDTVHGAHVAFGVRVQVLNFSTAVQYDFNGFGP